MENMKMSDVFELPVSVGEKAASHASAISDRSGTFAIINDSAMMQVSCAINNHDRLVEENAELRSNQEELLKAVKFLFSKSNNLNELQSKNISSMIEYNNKLPNK